MNRRFNVSTAALSCLILVALIWVTAFSVSAQPNSPSSAVSDRATAASVSEFQKLRELSLGFKPGQVRESSCRAVARVKSQEGVVLGPETGEEIGLYNPAGAAHLAGRFFVALEKHWLTSTDLVKGKLAAQVMVKGEEGQIIMIQDDLVILRQSNVLSAYSQNTLQLLWKHDFSADLGTISDNIACWPEYIVLVGQKKAGQNAFGVALVKTADGQIVWQNEFVGLFRSLAVSADNAYLAATENNTLADGAAVGRIIALNLSQKQMRSVNVSNFERFYACGQHLFVFTSDRMAADVNYLLTAYSPQLERLNETGEIVCESLPQWFDWTSDKISILCHRQANVGGWNFLTISSENAQVLSSLADSREIVQAIPDKVGTWLFLREEGAAYPSLFLLTDKALLPAADCALNLTDSPYLGCSAAISHGLLYAWGFKEDSRELQLFILDFEKNSSSVWTDKSATAANFVLYDGRLALVEKRENWLTNETFSYLKILNPQGGFLFTSEQFKGDFDGCGGEESSEQSSATYVLTSQGELNVFNDKGQIIGQPVRSAFFDWTKWNNLIGVLFLTGCILWFIFQAKRGKKLFIRKIAGLNALDEAVGRATEMGKPVLYIPGVGEIDDTQTMAALSVLGHVSSCTAEYDCPIMVPNCSPVVMSMAQDAVSQAYLKAGRPDSYVSDYICYLSGEQFGFAAGVCGLMVREKPAAILYMGTFLAEALMLAETGNSTGAIQIAGTASASQLPFFVAACDYTLIGEELYAASAYLSDDPMQIGSLKGQDAAKALIMILIIVGVLCLSFGCDWINYLW